MAGSTSRVMAGPDTGSASSSARECSINCSSGPHRGCDRNPRTGTKFERVLTARCRRSVGAYEPRLQAGDQTSGGARLGPDASETEAGTEISTGGATPMTSATTPGDHTRLG